MPLLTELPADIMPHPLSFGCPKAALSPAIVSYNLCVMFQRRQGWLERVTAASLRFRLFTTGGILSRTAGRTTIRLSVPEREGTGGGRC